MELLNKVAIITGATGGIGEAVAKTLDAAGMKLVLTGRSQEKLEKLASNLNDTAIVAGEITDRALPQKLLDTALQKFGRLDVAFSNAGVMTVGPVGEIDIESICDMARINVESIYRLAYTVLAHFKQVGSGFLIHTSSISGYKTVATYGAYCGTKHAVEAFTDSLRIELAGTGIRVAAIAPGTVDTGLYDQWDRESREWITSGGSLQPDDIARSVRFLLEQPDNVTIARLLVVPAAQPV